MGPKLNEIYHFLVYVDDGNLLEDNRNTVKENTEALIDSSKEAGLELNTNKTKYMFLSCQQNAGKTHNVKITTRSFENVTNFNCLGITAKM
jgi:hypothetical protein